MLQMYQCLHLVFFNTQVKFQTESQQDMRALPKNTTRIFQSGVLTNTVVHFYRVFAKHYEFFQSVSFFYAC